MIAAALASVQAMRASLLLVLAIIAAACGTSGSAAAPAVDFVRYEFLLPKDAQVDGATVMYAGEPVGTVRVRAFADELEYPTGFVQLPLDVLASEHPDAFSLAIPTPCGDLTRALRVAVGTPVNRYPQQKSLMSADYERGLRKRYTVRSNAVKAPVDLVDGPALPAATRVWIDGHRADHPGVAVDTVVMIGQRRVPPGETSFTLLDAGCAAEHAVTVAGAPVGRFTPDPRATSYVLSTEAGHCYRYRIVEYGRSATQKGAFDGSSSRLDGGQVAYPIHGPDYFAYFLQDAPSQTSTAGTGWELTRTPCR
jgi:hypothetical protein